LASPWLLGSVAWDGYLTKRAVIWLALRAGKAILRLSEADYCEHHLQVKHSAALVFVMMVVVSFGCQSYACCMRASVTQLQ
jgi:hypothetical protein